MNMNKTIGQCLEFYRSQFGWDQTQASGETDFVISQQQIGKFERGAIKNPGYFSLQVLLKAYGKTLADLEKDMAENVQLVEEKSNLYVSNPTIPLINIKDISIFLEGEDVPIVALIPVDANTGKKVYAVKMSNELMNSPIGIGYPKSSIVIFDANKVYRDNKDMMINTDKGPTFKHVFQDSGTYYLKGINPDYPNSDSTENLEYLGRAIECRIPVK